MATIPISVQRPVGLWVPMFRILDIDAGAEVRISNLQLNNGDALGPGGAIQNAGDLTLNSVNIAGNRSAAYGGGVHNTGSLKLNTSTIQNNQTAGAPLDQLGGGIFNDGYLEIVGSTIRGNRAVFGGGIYNSDGRTALVFSSWITENTVDMGMLGHGGSVFNAGTFTMEGGGISGNTATNLGGGLYSDAPGSAVKLLGVQLIGNQADRGGGFYLSSGILGLRDCTISFNTANFGNGGAYKPGAFVADLGGNSISDAILEDPN